MNLFSRIAAATLAAIAVAGPASAKPEPQAYNARTTKALVSLVERNGVRVFIDDPYCSKDDNEGRLMGAATSNRELLLCVENHGGDYPELADTVRHEIVHLAQYCKGRTVGATIATLSPRHSNAWLEHAINELNMPTDLYDKSQWRVEAEARVLAQYLTDGQIGGLYNEYCGPQSEA